MNMYLKSKKWIYASYLLLILWVVVGCKNKAEKKENASSKQDDQEFISQDFPESERDNYKLVWQDEFDYEGKPDPKIWQFEKGLVRNKEAQWYQQDNAEVRDGKLIFEARKEKVVNPDFDKNSTDWRKNRKEVLYTSSAIETRGKKEFHFGSIVVRARIDTTTGAWPAIWTLGRKGAWPENGEVDIMEFYQVDNKPTILANAMWGTWSTAHHPFEDFIREDPQWPDKFHTWRMDWDKESIDLYLDNQLMNHISFAEDSTLNKVGENPFLQPHFLLLNLAIDNRIDPSRIDFPIKYEVDYVRYYQKK